jgi:hypothetical protein
LTLGHRAKAKYLASLLAYCIASMPGFSHGTRSIGKGELVNGDDPAELVKIPARSSPIDARRV